MQVCVTGASGFIGRSLVVALSRQGHLVKVLTRHQDYLFHEGVQVVQGDLTSNDCPLDQFLMDCEVIFHCAGEIRDSETMYLLHVVGTNRLLEAVSKKCAQSKRNIHWVQLSSAGAYGPPQISANANRIVTEDTTPRPIGEYEITKVMADELVMRASEAGELTYTIVRPTNVFGVKMTNKSLFNLIAVIDRGLFFYIGQSGASANYIHVDNVVEGLINCGTNASAKGRIYNLSDYCTLEHFVKVISDELNRSAPQLRIPLPVARIAAKSFKKFASFPLTETRVDALVNRSIYSISRITNELDYKHVVSIEDGLRELVNVYKLRLENGETQ